MGGFDQQVTALLAVVCVVGVLAIVWIRIQRAGSKSQSSGGETAAGARATIPPIEDRPAQDAARPVAHIPSDATAGLSYAAIAAAEAEKVARVASPAATNALVQAVVIDYSNEEIDIRPGASYTAIAIAAARAKAAK